MIQRFKMLMQRKAQAWLSSKQSLTNRKKIRLIRHFYDLLYMCNATQ